MTVTQFTLPDGTVGNVGKCRSCKADIVWVITKNGKFAPMNADGTSHFATCPQAKKWSRKKGATPSSSDRSLGTSARPRT